MPTIEPKPGRVRPYQAGDEARLDLTGEMAREYQAMGGRVHDGPKWALTEGETVLAIGGLAWDADDGSHDLWCLSRPLRPRQWLMAFRATAARIRQIKTADPEVRIFVCAQPVPGARAFLTRLGFDATHHKEVLVL